MQSLAATRELVRIRKFESTPRHEVDPRLSGENFIRSRCQQKGAGISAHVYVPTPHRTGQQCTILRPHCDNIPLNQKQSKESGTGTDGFAWTRVGAELVNGGKLW